MQCACGAYHGRCKGKDNQQRGDGSRLDHDMGRSTERATGMLAIRMAVGQLYRG
jgi:hypothetical protein